MPDDPETLTPETPEDMTMPPQPTETFPRIRRTGPTVESTRLDVQRRFEVADPTVVTDPPFDPGIDNVTMRTRQQVRVSPIGTHTPARGVRYPAGYPTGGDVRPVDEINRLLDERERAEDRRSGRAAANAARTLREEAQRRAAAKLRHERHMERVEAVRAYLVLAITFCLFLIVVGAGVVGWGILSGWFAWELVRTP